MNQVDVAVHICAFFDSESCVARRGAVLSRSIEESPVDISFTFRYLCCDLGCQQTVGFYRASCRYV